MGASARAGLLGSSSAAMEPADSTDWRDDSEGAACNGTGGGAVSTGGACHHCGAERAAPPVEASARWRKTAAASAAKLACSSACDDTAAAWPTVACCSVAAVVAKGLWSLARPSGDASESSATGVSYGLAGEGAAGYTPTDCCTPAAVASVADAGGGGGALGAGSGPAEVEGSAVMVNFSAPPASAPAFDEEGEGWGVPAAPPSRGTGTAPGGAVAAAGVAGVGATGAAAWRGGAGPCMCRSCRGEGRRDAVSPVLGHSSTILLGHSSTIQPRAQHQKGHGGEGCTHP